MLLFPFLIPGIACRSYLGMNRTDDSGFDRVPGDSHFEKGGKPGFLGPRRLQDVPAQHFQRDRQAHPRQPPHPQAPQAHHSF